MAGDLHARHLVAQFQRQIKGRQRTRVAGLELEGRLAKALAARRQGMQTSLAGAAFRTQHLGVEAAAGANAGRGAERLPTRGAAHHRQPAAGKVLQSLGKDARVVVVIDAVGEPHGAGIAGTSKRRGDGLQHRQAIAGERLRLQGSRRRARGRRRLDLHGCAFGGWRGGGDEHRAALRLGLGNQPLDQARALAPVRRRRPGVVDGNDDRSGAGQAHFRDWH